MLNARSLIYGQIGLFLVLLGGCATSPHSTERKSVLKPLDAFRAAQCDSVVLVENIQPTIGSFTSYYTSHMIECVSGVEPETVDGTLVFTQFGLEPKIPNVRAMLYLKFIRGRADEWRVMGWHPWEVDSARYRLRQEQLSGPQTGREGSGKTP